MSNDVITVGSKTTTGGSVISGHGGVIINGQKVALVGDIATCPCGSKSCRGQGPIVAQSPRAANMFGTNLARVGDLVDTGCGNCFLDASSHQVSLSTSTATNLNMGSGVNIGNGVNINGGSGVTFSNNFNTSGVGTNNSFVSPQSSSKAAQAAYDLTEKEWNEDIKRIAKKYQWDTSQQENVSIAIMTVKEANEYLDLLIKDTHGQLSTGKDYTGVGMGLKGAYEVAKELGGWGATAKAININGVMNIVVENYKPRYLDLGISWQEATPQMLKIGHALNTVKGNISFLNANIYAEIVFSGAVNAVDYMLHNEKTLGEVIGQFTADISKGVVAGVIAQGALLVARAGAGFLFGFSLPAAVGLGLFVYSAFKIGGYISDLDNQYEFTKPMKETVEDLID
ncbi:PAAR domain-containing protein [Photobacterium sp. GB-27]|uniref:PAAR domain-containing protein n=1 Tax=Photobacterium sp. GB-27 TaxID=2022109 RepID=UPI001E5E4290|nr:PAAR domain-containing protein [Photobacterium sp. GB-27]